MSDIIEYNRPNEDWECGWASRGFRCHVGPSAKGKCQKKGECHPVKKDDGYHCTRLPQYGGKCHQGPLPDGTCSKKFPPCSPKRSLRAKRGIATISLIAFSLGLLFFMLGKRETGAAFFNPGAVTFQHSSFMNDCASCHKASHDTPLNWLFAGGGGRQEPIKCLGCHQMGQHPYQPHSLPASELQVITAGLMGEGHKSVPRELQCNSCHKEHRGSNFDLTHMTKKQCQSCHAETFHSLAKGHPEFENYPNHKRVNILFDHTSHFNQHFPEKEGGDKISCNSCHSPSETGGLMVLNGFESTCASCHKEQIHGDDAVEKGIVVFRLPTLDLESLRAKGVHVGSWPEDADGELTPFMKLLLAAEEEVKAALDHLGDNEITMDDLEEAETETFEHVGKIVWSIKSLLKSIRDEGPAHLQERLTNVLGRDVDKDELVKIMAGLPLEVVRSSTNNWFNAFDKEMEALEEGKGARTRVLPSPDDEIADEDQMNVGGWYRDDGSFTIKYRPSGHADHFLRGWLGIATELYTKDASAKEVFEALGHRTDSPGACMKCHGVEQQGQRLEVKWEGYQEKIGSQQFVRFSHAKHLNLLQEEGCYTCHQTNNKADFSKAYEGFDPTVFESNFYSLKKDTCVRCHAEGKVKDNCLTCHNYHIGDFFTTEEQMKGIHTKLGGGEATEDDESSESEEEESGSGNEESSDAEVSEETEE